LATPDTEAFERCFFAWVAAQKGVPAEVFVIDRKTMCRSGSKNSKKKDPGLQSTSCRLSPRVNVSFSATSGGGEVQRDRRHRCYGLPREVAQTIVEKEAG
jgi:hypothetical protein